MMSSSIKAVLGDADCPEGVGEQHEVLMMYTSCSRTDSAMRTSDSPDSFRVTVDFPRGTPRLIERKAKYEI